MTPAPVTLTNLITALGADAATRLAWDWVKGSAEIEAKPRRSTGEDDEKYPR
jgi:hypothetical protein